MSTISGWVGSGAAVVIIGLCAIISYFMHHLPALTHPWIRRLLILGMYFGGAALAVTALGAYAHKALEWVLGLIGGPASGLGFSVLVLTGVFLVLAVIVGLIWVPDFTTAIIAAVLPLILGLAVGGWLYHIYAITTYPAQSVAEAVAHGLGG